MFKKMDSSVIIILCFLALFVYEVHDAIVSRDKSLQTVCASYSKLVDAVNKEVPDREYTINGGGSPDMKTEEGKNHWYMINLQQKIQYECRNEYGINSRLPSPQELRGQKQ